MGKASRNKKSALLSVALGAAALLVVIGIVRSPGEAFRASLSGLEVWWQNVFPGLLPPLILADLLAVSGLLHGVAALAEPLTRRLFRLPGASGWAIGFGWSAGIPAGAKETARLRECGMIGDDDVDTVLLVSHVPNPFLIVLVVGYGFLQAPELGWAIALGLWLSAIISGMIWARIVKAKKPKVPVLSIDSGPRALLRRAYRSVSDARQDDGRPFGKQLADSVSHSVGTLMAVGGLMMMSAVIIKLIQLAIPGNDMWLAFPGFYEMHLGAYDASKSALFGTAPEQAAALLAAALAWSGWSGLLQARAAFRTGKESESRGAYRFPWGKWISGRLLHGAVALAVTYPLAKSAMSEPVSDFLYAIWPSRWPAVDAWATEGPLPDGWGHLADTLTVSVASFSVFLLLAVAAALIRPKPPAPVKRDEDVPPVGE